MKRKIFSILFALVLVVSFSLVTAAPASAGAPTAVLTDGGTTGIDSLTDNTPEDSGTEVGQHSIEITDATACDLTGTDAEHDTNADTMANDLGGDETLLLTIGGEAIETAALATATAGTTTLTNVADDIEAKINAQTTNVDVDVSVAGTSPGKYFVITVDLAGASNSITTQVTGTNGGATETGLGGVDPVAGTDASAVDTMTPPAWPGEPAPKPTNELWKLDGDYGDGDYEMTITYSPPAGTASDLTGLEAIVETAGSFIEGVTIAAGGGLSEGIATIAVNPGAASYFVVHGAPTMTAGGSIELKIVARDDAGNIDNNYEDGKNLTFTGLADAPDGTGPTVETHDFDTEFSVGFTDGVSNLDATTLVAYCAETATVDVSDDGGINSTGHGLALTVNPDVVADLSMVQQPTDAVAGVAIAPAVTVLAKDQFDNPVPGQSVTASLQVGTGTLSGTKTKMTAPPPGPGAGIATFNDLSINLIGADKQLQFTADAITEVSAVFGITPAAFDADESTVEVDDNTVTAGTEVVVTVTPKDEFGNLLGAAQIVVVLLDDDAFDYDGDITVTDVGDGTYTADVKVTDTSAANVISASVGGSAITQEQTITVSHSVLNKYTVVPEAGPYTAGTAFNVVITAVDVYNNPLGSDYATAAPYDWTTTASDAPDGTPPGIGSVVEGNFTDGVATKSVTLFCAEDDVTFTVTDTNLITGTSAGIDVDPNVLTALVVVDEPDETVAGEFIIAQVKAVDFWGNALEGVTVDVTEVGAYAFDAGTLSQDTVATGIATFGDLVINTAAVGYQLHFEVVDETSVNSATFDVVPAAIDHYSVSAIADPQAAGTSFDVTIQAQDEFNNDITTGVDAAEDITISFGLPDAGATPTTGATVGGTATISMTMTVAQANQSITFTGEAAAGTSNTFNVDPGAAADITISPEDSTIAAGDDETYTVLTVDEYGNTVEDVSEPTTFDIDDEAGGTWTFNVYTSQFAGTWTVTADYDAFSVNTSLTVTGGAAVSIEILPATANVTAGETQTYTVSATDALSNTWDVTDTAGFAIDAGAGGSWADNVYTSETAGEWTVTATLDALEDTATLTVNPGEAAAFIFDAIADQTAGEPFEITITAEDAYRNTATDYAGTPALTDTTDTISPTVTDAFTDGVWTGSVTITKADTGIVITATDGAATGDSNAFNVDPNVATSFGFDAIVSQQVGTAFNITITAYDAYDNVATGYSGTVDLTDLTGTLSETTDTFTDGVLADWSVTISLARGADTITANDHDEAGITGTSDPFNVYDLLIDLNDNAWTLVSTDDYILNSGTNTSAFEGTVTLKYKHTSSGYLSATVADLEPVEAIYAKTTGTDGQLGLNYSTEGAPGASVKELVAGWNLVSSATEGDAAAILSPLRYVQVGEQQGVGLATLVSQDSYNLNTNDWYIDATTWGNVEAIPDPMIPFDGYWVYLNAAKSFGVIP